MYLNTHSYYSLRYGTLKPEALLQKAREYGVKALVLTDINTTSACLEFIQLAPKYAIKPIVGVDFRNGAQQQFVLIAKSNTGYQAINTYLSHLLHQHLEVPKLAPVLEDTFVVYPYRQYSTQQKLKSHEFVGLSSLDLNPLKYSKKNIEKEKLVILHPATFLSKKDFNSHRLLRAIDNNTLLSKLAVEEQAEEWHKLLPVEELLAPFCESPYLIENTKAILENCSIHFEFNSTPNNQKSYLKTEALDYKLLKKLAYDGIAYRYPNNNDPKVIARIERELGVIKEKQFVSYFLINWKVLKFARSKDY